MSLYGVEQVMRRSGLCQAVLLVVTIAATAMASACVRRTVTITTDPPQALVYLNDEEIGRSTVSRDFLWYGDYDVVIRKEGYETLQTHWEVEPPWYQRIPFDFFAEVLWPGHLHDAHERHFVLAPYVAPNPEDVVKRALETRAMALDPRK